MISDTFLPDNLVA